MTLVNLTLAEEIKWGENSRALKMLDTGKIVSYNDVEALKVPPALIRYVEGSKPIIQMNHPDNIPAETDLLLLGEAKIPGGETRPVAFYRMIRLNSHKCCGE